MSESITIEIDDVFVVSAYRQVQADEGSYDVRCGFNVIARSKQTPNGNYGYWVCTGPEDANGNKLARVYQTEAWAIGFANMIRGVGKIRIVHWYCFEEKNVNDLPDYVTDPHNPLFN